MAEIPKPFSQVQSGLAWPKTLLTASAACFGLALASFLVLAGYERAVTRQSKDLDQEIQDIAASISPAEIQKLLVLDSQIKSLKELLPQHIYMSRVLEYLEVHAVPTARLMSLSANARRARISLQGSAPDAKTVSVQAAAYENAQLTKEFFIRGVGPGPGGLSFVFELTFDRALVLPR